MASAGNPGARAWDADGLRDIVRDYALEALADPDAILVFDETGFLKQSKASCSVGRQYTGSVGKITNCQIGVFASYVSRHGHAFIDRALYLLKAWTGYAERMARAHVPDKTSFATKPALALTMIERGNCFERVLFLGGGRQRRRYRDGAQTDSQGLCAGRECQPSFPFMG